MSALAVLACLCVAAPLEEPARPFDRRLVEALEAGSPQAEDLVRGAPGDAFMVFHGHIDAAFFWGARGDAERAAFSWRVGERLSEVFDRVQGRAVLRPTLERCRAIHDRRVLARLAADDRWRGAARALGTGDPARAAAEAGGAAEAYAAIGDLQGEARARHIAGAAGDGLGDGAAEDALREAARLYGLTGDLRGGAKASAILAGLLQREERYSAAAAAYAEARDLFERAGDEEDAWRQRSNLGTCLASLGRTREALPHLEACERRCREKGDAPALAHAVAQTAMARLARGEYGVAIGRFLEALAVLGEGKDRPRDRARVLLQLGEAYGELRLSAAARERIGEARSLAAEHGAPELETRSLLALARVALDESAAAEAEDLARRALEAGPSGTGARAGGAGTGTGGGHGAVEARRLLALARLERGDGSAVTLLEEARSQRAAAGSTLQRVLCDVDLGDAHRRAGRLPEAEGAYAAALAGGAGLPEAAWRAHAGLGELRERAGDPEGAVDRYRSAIALLEDLLLDSRAPALRSGFFEGRERAYHRLAALLASRGRAEEALEVAQGLRARSAADALIPARSWAARSLPAALAARREDLLERLAGAAAALEEAREPEASARAEADLRRARAEHRELLVEAELAAPAPARALGAFRPRSLDSLREALGSGGGSRALLVYLVTPEDTHLWTVRASGLRHRTLGTGEAALREKVRRLLEPFAAFRGGAVDLTNLELDAGAARELYRILIGPAEEDLAGAVSVLIAADGPLHQLPFELLVVEGDLGPVDHGTLFAEYRRPRYLIDRHAVSYVLSLAELGGGDVRRAGASGTTAGAAGGEALVLADPAGARPAGTAPALLRSRRGGPLPLARQEARAVARALGGRARILEGADATEAALAAGVARAGLVHIAAHAWVEERAPLYSAIGLAPGPGADGILEAHEVLELDLSGKLVVLSGCETAAGPVQRGEGLESLARAFLLAGARGVVGSLWRVDDSAALLMERFHEALARGLAPAEAIREAKLALLRRLEGKGFAYALPFFWAPFVLVER